MSDEKTVVIVEDDVLIATDFKMMCEEAGATVLDVLRGADGAADRIRALAPTHVLLNVRLKNEGDGVEVADDLRAGLADTRLVFVTGSNEPPTMERMEDDAPYRVLIKPVSDTALREALGA